MKTINLDLTKREGLTKAFTSRVADENDKLHVILTDEGQPVYMDNIKGIVLKATSPTGKYFYVNGEKTEDGVTFVIPSGFNSEKGYFQNAYVEVDYNNGGVRSTQPFMYYAYGDADLTDSNAGDYISRVEELIKELNEKVDAMINSSETKINELEVKINNIKQELEDFLNTFENARPLFFRGKMADVDWDTIKGTNQAGIYYISGVKASADKHTPVTSGTLWGQLTVTVEGVVIQTYTDGAVMYQRRLSGNPLAWSNWRTYLTDGTAYTKQQIDDKLKNVTVDAYTKEETDNKINAVKNTIPVKATTKEIIDGVNDSKFITPKALKDAVKDDLEPHIGYFDVGTPVENTKSTYPTLKIGSLKGTSLGGEQNKPYTVNGDGTLTFTRAVRMQAETMCKFVAGTTSPPVYGYFELAVGANKHRIGSLGSTADGKSLNYDWTVAGSVIIDAKVGDKLYIAVSLPSGRTTRLVQCLGLTLTEIPQDNNARLLLSSLAEDADGVTESEVHQMIADALEADKASMIANKKVFVIDSKNSTYIKGGSIKLERVGDQCFMSGIINNSVEIPTKKSILTSGTLPDWFNSDSNRNAISIFGGKLTNCYYESSSNTIMLDSAPLPAGSWLALNASSFPAKSHI